MTYIATVLYHITPNIHLISYWAFIISTQDSEAYRLEISFSAMVQLLKDDDKDVRIKAAEAISLLHNF